jgi:predicted nucleic acid-binding protein
MILVDANVLIDLFTDDPEWATWSEEALAESALTSDLVINPIIYGEVSIAFKDSRTLDNALTNVGIRKIELPYPAAFAAGKAFLRYRQKGGLKRSPLPDFLIGAHAKHLGLSLLTRDTRRYRTYFPTVELICPDP